MSCVSWSIFGIPPFGQGVGATDIEIAAMDHRSRMASTVLAAATRGDTAELLALLQREHGFAQAQSLLCAADDAGVTPLHGAVFSGSAECVHILLELRDQAVFVDMLQNVMLRKPAVWKGE